MFCHSPRLTSPIPPFPLSEEGEIKLCDLGVSGTMENSLALSHVGTMTYMAPERIESHDAYTIHADVWSLGLTVLELAIGYYPYPPRAPGEEAVVRPPSCV